MSFEHGDHARPRRSSGGPVRGLHVVNRPVRWTRQQPGQRPGVHGAASPPTVWIANFNWGDPGDFLNRESQDRFPRGGTGSMPKFRSPKRNRGRRPAEVFYADCPALLVAKGWDADAFTPRSARLLCGPPGFVQIVMELLRPRGVAELGESLRRNLPDSLPSEVELPTDLIEGSGMAVQ